MHYSFLTCGARGLGAAAEFHTSTYYHYYNERKGNFVKRLAGLLSLIDLWKVERKMIIFRKVTVVSLTHSQCANSALLNLKKSAILIIKNRVNFSLFNAMWGANAIFRELCASAATVALIFFSARWRCN